MKKLFVPQELAVKLKEKGFYEPCLALYEKGQAYGEIGNMCFHMIGQPNDYQIYTTKDWKQDDDDVSAPLYQQVIDWFEEKHQIFIWVTPEMFLQKQVDVITFKYDIDNKCEYTHEQGDFKNKYDAYNKGIEEAIKLI